jgi:hypothetical protein
VTHQSESICQSKSQNKLNRIFCQATPIDEPLVNAIESRVITPSMDAKFRARQLQREYRWDQTDAKRVRSFGPDLSGPNLIFDTTKSAEYLQECRDNIFSPSRQSPRGESSTTNIFMTATIYRTTEVIQKDQKSRHALAIQNGTPKILRNKTFIYCYLRTTSDLINVQKNEIISCFPPGIGQIVLSIF